MERGCFSRNLGTISPAQQRKLQNARIVVAGLGGVGGIAAELLVRAGVEHLLVIDFDRFEETNLNRQIHANKKTIGKKKVDVFAKKMKEINPHADVKTMDAMIEAESEKLYSAALEKFSPDIVIDTMDSAHSRVMLWRMCKKAKFAYVYAAAMGARGMVGVLEGRRDLEKMLRMPSHGRVDAEVEAALVHYPRCRSAWGPATNLTGVLACDAALNFLLKKPYPRAPDFWMVDAFRKDIVREQKLG